ncbi:MAG TPA: response regulator [Bacteroidota bacterium]|nr:response regulator [Bacteroidota bacterium]
MSKNQIFFIEDEPQLLESIAQFLRDQGYQVDAFLNAELALKLLQTKIPDLVLADIKLPGIDGFEFFQEMKKNPAWANIPVIFITAFNDMKAMRAAKSIGIADYLTKPFDLDDLISRIQKFLA